MRQLASLIFVWSLGCCFQENLVGSFKCASSQMTVQWPNSTFKECLNCAECHPGHGLYPHNCGDTITFPAIIECKKCESGKTFSDTYDTSSCKLCHLCAEHEVVTKKCTPSSDTKCNKTCNSGYFFSKPQQFCQMCSYCCLDGKDEKQPQCINQGLKAVDRYCSPRPDRTCNPSTPTGPVIYSTESRSSLKHPSKPSSQQQHGKIKWILSCIGIALLFGLILVFYCQWGKIRRRTNRKDNAQNVSNLEEGCVEPSEGRLSNQEGSMLQAPRLQEVQQNKGFESASSTPQGSHKGIPHTGGEPVPYVNVLPKHFGGERDRTKEKKGNQGGSMLQAPRLQEVQLNEGFESASSTPQGSRKGIPQHTGGKPVLYVDIPPKHFSGQPPDRTKEKKGNQGGSMLQAPRLQEVQQNEGFESASSSTPQGSCKGMPQHTGGEPVLYVNVLPKHFSGQPDRTKEKKVNESARVNTLDNKDIQDDVSDKIAGKGVQSGRERKRSFSGHQTLLCGLSSGSSNYESFPREDLDEPGEVSASGDQRKRPRSNSLLNAFRKSSVHAVMEENPDQPSGQSWPPKEVTIEVFPDSQPQAGSRVEFQCTVRGCQHVFYRWFKDGQELQGKDNSTLILDSLEVKDFGFYKCEVRSDKRYESNCVASEVVELDVTPAEGKNYKKLAESPFTLKETVADLLEKETKACRKAYKHVASKYGMNNINQLERSKNPGEDVLGYLESAHPDLTVYQFCKVLKGEYIKRLDIVNKLAAYLI